MIEIEELKRILADRNLQAVAKGAGIHPNALYRLMAGKSDPRYSTVKRIMAYLIKEQKNG